MTQQSNPTKVRITFAMRYQSLGMSHYGRKIFAALLESGVVDAEDKPHASNFALLLAHTDAITSESEHPEMRDLMTFWAWWTEHKKEQPLNAVTLWEKRLELVGFKAAQLWNKAFSDEQATPLDAPRELLPDNKLTEEERADSK